MPFMLDFGGMSTRLGGIVAGASRDALVVATAVGRVRAPGRAAPGASVLVAVRPENLRLGPARGGENTIELKVRDPVFLGSKLLVHFHAPDGDHAVAELAAAAGHGLAAGD